MATVNASTSSFGFDLGDLAQRFADVGTVVTKSATSFTYRPSALWGAQQPLLTAQGVGFTFGADGLPTGGTVTSLTFALKLGTAPATTVMTISGFSAPALGLPGSVDALVALLSGNDTIIGTNFADVLYGLGGNDSMLGGAGNDTLWGDVGNDTLDGGAGLDLIRAGDGDDLGRGGTGNDTLYGGLGADKLYGGADNDIAYGEDGNDSLLGEAGLDTLYGGLGLDKLYGGADNDALYGDDGNDTLFGGAGSDALDGGAGADTAAFSDLALQGIYGRGVTVDLVDGTAKHTYFTTSVWGPSSPTAEEVDRLVSIENIIGSGAADFLYGSAIGNTIAGDGGADLIDGRAGNDTLYGQAGDDILIGGDGADRLDGGDGNDTFIDDAALGPHSNDTIVGGAGVDTADYNLRMQAITADMTAGTVRFAGSSEIDRISGIENVTTGDLDDKIFGDAANNAFVTVDGNDTIYGYAGDDTITAGYGNDWIDAGDGNDWVFESYKNGLAEWGNDTIYGGAGDDHIDCGFGNDVVDAGTGNDVIRAYDGSSIVNAGDGNDLIVVQSGYVQGTLGAGSDTFKVDSSVRPDFYAEINDFVSGQDFIDLSGFGLTAANRGTRWDVQAWNGGVGIEFRVDTFAAGTIGGGAIFLRGLTLDQFAIEPVLLSTSPDGTKTYRSADLVL